MKKIIARTLCLVVSLMMIFQFSASAQTNIAPPENVPNMFKDFVSAIYSNDYYRYLVSDSDSEEVTEQFVLNTKNAYHSNDWEFIYRYVLENTLNISYLEHEFQLYNGDLSRTYSQYCVEEVYFTLPSGVRTIGWLQGTLTGTILYNPNTGTVSSVSTTTVDMPFISDMANPEISNESTASYKTTYTGVFQYRCLATSRMHLVIDLSLRMSKNNSTDLTLELVVHPIN